MRRRIKPNHRCTVPACHVVLDTETARRLCPGAAARYVNVLTHGQACAWRYEAGVVTRERWTTFSNSRQWWDWLYGQTHPRLPTWIWAHSMGFDLQAVQVGRELTAGRLALSQRSEQPSGEEGELVRDGWWKGLAVTEDPPTILLCRSPAGHTLRFLCTLQWLPAPLEELAAEVGLPKLPMPGPSSPECAWADYCRRDVESLVEIVRRLHGWVKRYDLGNLRSTIAAQALASWRHGRMDCPVTLDNERTHKERERSCYYDGRRHCYYVGDVGRPGAYPGPEPDRPGGVLAQLDGAPVYKLDITSCYPSVMADEQYPIAYVKTIQPARLDELKGQLRAYEACARVRLHSPLEPFPRRLLDRVSWQVGSFWTDLAGADLRLALALDVVREVDWVQLYRAGRPFRSWVKHVWTMRQEMLTAGDKLGLRLAKGLAVALHGKLAQKGGGWEVTGGRLALDDWGTHWVRNPDTGQVDTYRYLGREVQQRQPDAEGADSIPLVAAYVSAYARARVRAARLVAGPGNVLYEEADSLHVTTAGYRAVCRAGLIHPGELGRLRVDGVFDSATYLGPRYYRVGEQWVRAGIRRNAATLPDGRFRQDNFRRLDQAVEHPPEAGPVCWDVVVDPPRPVIDGEVGLDGWVTPHRAGEEG